MLAILVAPMPCKTNLLNLKFNEDFLGLKVSILDTGGTFLNLLRCSKMAAAYWLLSGLRFDVHQNLESSPNCYTHQNKGRRQNQGRQRAKNLSNNCRKFPIYSKLLQKNFSNEQKETVFPTLKSLVYHKHLAKFFQKQTTLAKV